MSGWSGLMDPEDETWSRRRVFVYEIVVLCSLWTFAGLHITGVLVLPDQFGSIPLGVPFFGALGAVLISLTAVFDFRGHGWDPTWEAWHYTRWLIGGTVAIVSVLIFQAGILATGLSLSSGGGTNTNTAYYLIAFAIGYREQTFRELVKRLVEAILTPGAGMPPPSVLAVSPNTGSVSGGEPVAITGTNLARVTAVLFADADAKIGHRSSTSVTVTTPKAKQPGQVPVTLETTNGSDASKTFIYQ